jgi:hypothetical protein
MSLSANGLNTIAHDYAAISMSVRILAPTEEWAVLATGNFPYTEDSKLRRECVRIVAARAWLADHEADEASDLEVSPLRTSERSPDLVSVTSTYDIHDLLNEEDDIFAWADVEMLGHNNWGKTSIEGIDLHEERLLHAFRLGRKAVVKAARNLKPENVKKGAELRRHVEVIAAELEAHRASAAA